MADHTAPIPDDGVAFVAEKNGLLSTSKPADTVSKPEWSVASALTSFSLSAPSKTPTTPIPFLNLLERLKTTPREGWRRFSINNGESIADHMYRMSIITLLAPPRLAERLDLGRCTRMALVHDMAEALVGDITPVDGVAKVEKSRREGSTMDYMAGTLLRGVPGKGGEEIETLWREYEDGQTDEARFVHDVDKFELVLQMVEYERRGEGGLDLGEFVWVAEKIEMSEVREWCAEVLEERLRFWAGKRKGKGEVKALELASRFVANVRKDTDVA